MADAIETIDKIKTELYSEVEVKETEEERELRESEVIVLDNLRRIRIDSPFPNSFRDKSSVFKMAALTHSEDQTSAFGSTQQPNQSLVIGESQQQNQGSSAIGQSGQSSVFGQQVASTASNVFGGQSQPQNSTFGQQQLAGPASPGSSIFGNSGQPTTSATSSTSTFTFGSAATFGAPVMTRHPNQQMPYTHGYQYGMLPYGHGYPQHHHQYPNQLMSYPHGYHYGGMSPHGYPQYHQSLQPQQLPQPMSAFMRYPLQLPPSQQQPAPPQPMSMAGQQMMPNQGGMNPQQGMRPMGNMNMRPL